MRNFVLIAIAGSLVPAQTTLTAPQIRSIAERGYMFAYPMVLMEYTRRGSAAANTFTHLQKFPDDTFHQVIRPNADTLYSSSWIDLSKEPVLLHVPDTHGRYYLMQFMDAWTETFAVPGARTTGTGEGWFAIVGPNFKESGRGELPQRAQRVDAPTNTVWLIGRTQTNGASDYENVHAIQRGYQLMTLSQYPDGPRAGPGRGPAQREGERPPSQVAKLSAKEFFATFASLLVANPPHRGDEAMMAELKKIGIEPGKPFRAEALGPEGMKGLEEGARLSMEWLASLDGRVGRAGPTGWTGGAGGAVGRYGTNYRARAQVARIGLGANPPEDAVYMHCQRDSNGQALDGAKAYRVHFDAGKLPPVKAFWSLTVYSPDGYFVKNPINRFAIGDRDALKKNADGSVDIYIQHVAPGGDRDANWLPSPEGEFNLSLRMYWPGDEILKGAWVPPAVVAEGR